MLPASQSAAMRSMDSAGGGPIVRPHVRGINPNDSTGGPIKPNDSTGGPIKLGAKKRMKPADSTGGPIVGKHH